MTGRTVSIACAITGIALLSACSAGHPDASPQTAGSAGSSGSWIDNRIDHVLHNAKVQLATKNLTVSNDDDDDAPKAEITPQGDFVVAGKSVPLTSAQRAEVLAYRQQLIGVAEQGIEIGKQGAELGMNAASEAIAGVFSGESRQRIHQRVEAQASGIRNAAENLCDRLPALMAEQHRLAAALPAFKPYATMTQQGIDNCHANARKETSADN